jgi:tetratricopeptide (TPR) repeat protein
MTAGGWAGETEGMKDGSQPQPWHCLPFIEGATYGLELVYPYETECRVVHDAAGVRFDFDYAGEPGGVLSGGEFIFFNAPGKPQFYLFNTRIDIQAPPGHVLRTEPHPRFFTDPTGTAPLALIGNVQSEWYPRMLFVVFKVPPPGGRHVFRKGEPFAQVVFVPHRAEYSLRAFSPDEEAARRDLDDSISLLRSQIARREWRDPDGNRFNDHYKVLSRAFTEGGMDGVRRAVDAAREERAGALPATLDGCLAAGEALIARDEYDQAKSVYAHALSLAPDHPAALRQMGICLACTGGPAAGLRLMERAAQLEPSNPDHPAALGRMLTLLGRHRDAEGAYRAALRAGGPKLNLLNALAVALANQGRLDEALAACRSSLAVKPHPQAHEMIGTILAHQRRHAAARAAYDAALALDPAYEPARKALARLPRES